MLAFLLACGDGGLDSGGERAPETTFEPWYTPPQEVVGTGEGSAWLEPSSLTVHSEESVTLVYVVGPGGLAPGDALRIEDPVFHGMRISKWARFVTDPTECGPAVLEEVSGALVTATTTGDASVVVERSTLSEAIHLYATTDVWLDSGSLEEGDEIRVVFGDTAVQGDGTGGADCAMQTSPRAFHSVPWRLWEQRADSGELASVQPSPTFDILARQQAADLAVHLPSQAVAGEPVDLRVAVLDDFGNAVEDFEGTVQLGAAYGGQVLGITAADSGVLLVELVLDEGVQRVPVQVGELSATSNPVKVTAQPPEQSVFWGDIHSHHGHSSERPDGSWHDENVLYGRDVIGLDVTSESTKLKPVEIDGNGIWLDLQRSCEELSVDGEHIVLLGFEWLGGEEGHHNVYYDRCQAELGSRELDSLADGGGLWDWLDAQAAATGVDAVAIPHATLYTGYDWKRSRRVAPDLDRRFRTAIEVYSHWGSSMEPADEPGSVQSGLARGVRAGFLASSDSHNGWTGNPLYFEKSAYPGLAAFLAPELSRGAIFDALQQRRTYATTGPRILVDWGGRTDQSEVGPGEVLAGDGTLDLWWEVHGTDAIQALRVVAVPVGGKAREELLYEETPGELDSQGQLSELVLPAGEVAVWLEVEQADGNRAWASPIYVEGAGCGGCATGSRTAWLAGLLLLLPLVLRRRHGGPSVIPVSPRMW